MTMSTTKPASPIDALVGELERTVREANELVRELSSQVGDVATDAATPPPPPASDVEVGDIMQQLDDVSADRDRIQELAVETEQQLGKLTNLYVAIHQLHATLEPEQVARSIAEIAVDLLGAESFVLLVSDESDNCHVAQVTGTQATAIFAVGTRYDGGHRIIDEALSRSEPLIERTPEGEVAVVPLRVEDRLIGAFAILSVFPHKAGSLDDDREMLDLLAAHAGTALLAAEGHAAANRRLETLQGLMTLLPHQS